MKATYAVSLGVCALSLVGTDTVRAAGFAVRAQSASNLGTAGAADAAGNQDITAIFSNPASIAAFPGQHVVVGAGWVQPKGSFRDGERSYTLNGGAVDKGESKTEDSFSKNAAVPALYGVHQVADSVSLGWSVTAPFGTYSDYGKDWIGRYHGVKTELQVVNFDLGASYKLNDQLAFGFGVQVQKAKGEITGASNFGAGYAGGLAKASVSNVQTALEGLAKNDQSAYAALSASDKKLADAAIAAKTQAVAANQTADEITAAVAGVLKNAASAAVKSADGTADVFADYSGENYAAGYEFGVQYKPLSELNLGLSYRSQVKHKNKGSIGFSGDATGAQAYIASQAFEKDASLNLTLPDAISFGAAYQGINDLKLFANITQTRWSSVDALNVTYKSGAKGDQNILVKLGWKDVLSYSVGAAYSVQPEILLRAGLGVDKSPTTDALRSPRSPDADRTLASLGATYHKDNWHVDLGYMHTAIKTPKLQLKEADYIEAAGRGDLVGSYKVSANTFMLQYGQAI